MQHIDLSTVLRQTVACDLYSNLVTRPTGAAVRGQIEQMLEGTGDRSLTVIDLSHVSMIDFSCADEVIAKLLLRYCEDNPPQDAYFLFRGVSDDHWDAIETVLERHGLALVVESTDRVQLVGVVEDGERRMWEAVRALGVSQPHDVAEYLGDVPEQVERELESLWRRRLVTKIGGRYSTVGHAAG
jgi:hypothetical protein